MACSSEYKGHRQQSAGQQLVSFHLWALTIGRNKQRPRDCSNNSARTSFLCGLRFDSALCHGRQTGCTTSARNYTARGLEQTVARGVAARQLSENLRSEAIVWRFVMPALGAWSTSGIHYTVAEPGGIKWAGSVVIQVCRAGDSRGAGCGVVG